MDAFCFPVDETELEGFSGVQPGKAEAYGDAPVLEAGLVVDVRGVPRLLCGALDLECTSVQIGLFELGDPVRRCAVPAVADCLGECSVLLPFKGVVENKGAVLLESEGVGRSGS